MDKHLKLLQQELKKKLPGKSAHQELMPETRKIYQNATNTLDAGVLVLIYPNRKNKLSVVFIKRPEYNGPHSSQISFPGGKTEKADRSLEETALRESQEEIGINKDDVNIFGKLSTLYIPVSNFLVHPFVGYMINTPNFSPDKNEVEYIIETELSKAIKLQKKTLKKLIQDKPYNIPYFEIKGEIVWGATAMILNEFITVAGKVNFD